MHKHNGKRRLFPVLIACILAALACKYPGGMETLTAFTMPSTPLAASATPTEPAAVDTATPTEIEPIPTTTLTPIPPSPTATPIPPTDTLDISGWFNVVGTWSGCADDEEPGVPYATIPCSGPSGRFVTLWIKPTCTIGEYCGNYVKGMFESEYIRLKLTLIGLKGPVVWMHGVSSSPIYSYADTDVAIQREGGSRVRITEKAGDKWIYILRPRCDSVIVESTTIGCFEYLS
jgi:hypothetical protein